VTQETIGLSRARSVDTFATTGYLFGASIPLVLETAQHRGLLSRGDLVVLHGGGIGATYGAIVLRWGDPVA
jgi:3-oxoacyl-[acyl-carrier-protein] synthase-3